MKTENLFVLVNEDGGIVPPMDCNPGCEDAGMMVYETEDGANRAASRQNDMFGLNCRAVPLSEA